MVEIKVMEKPEWVSWDDIHELLLAAHKKNIEKGMTMQVAQMSPEDLKRKLGDKGKCFVALANDKLVGTTSVRLYQGRSWYDKDLLVAHSKWSAILPKYQGVGIAEDLYQLRDTYIEKMGVKMIHADTAENNTIVRKKAMMNGFVDVAYHAYKSDHYSVIFVKWLDDCPFNKRFIKRKFNLSKTLTKIQFKVGGVERSRVLSVFCNVFRKLFNVV